MKKEEIYNVIARDLSGSPENNDSKEITKWTQSKKSNYLIFKVIRNYFLQHPSDNSSAESFERLKARIEENGSRMDMHSSQQNHNVARSGNWQAWLRYAAILLVTLGLSWTAYDLTRQKETAPLQAITIEKSNPNGRKTIFELPDGTRVNLNAASELKYIEDVENSKRVVYLSGEAFFDVAKDKTKPFSVITKGISTTALGTSFNVKAYAEDTLVKVLLMTGKVGVEYLSGQSNGLILNPGMGAEYDSNKGDLVSKEFDFEKEIGWKQGIIVLDKVGLPTVIQKLERWYGVKIQIQNKQKAGDWNYSGRFQNESLENVLSTMGHVKGFEHKIENKTVTIIFK